MKTNYRVVYGDPLPAWVAIFTTWTATARFIKKCIDRGDTVFSVSETDEVATRDRAKAFVEP